MRYSNFISLIGLGVLFILGVFSPDSHIFGQNEARDAIFPAGGALSRPLVDIENFLADTSGPDFNYNNVLLSPPFNLTKGVVKCAEDMAIDMQSRGNSDIIGVGHDIGGLVLRQLQHESDELTAMVLIGTPNQGSQLLRYFFDPSFSDPELLLESTLNLVAQDDCPDCEIFDIFANWINGIRNASYMEDAKETSPVIADLNAMEDNIPFINIIGDQTPKTSTSLLAMLDSRVTTLNTPALVDCFIREQNEAEKDLEIKEKIELIESSVGFFTHLMNSISNAISIISDPTEIPSVIRDEVSSSKEMAIRTIERIHTNNRERARLARCNLAVSYFTVQWNNLLLDISADGVFEVEETEIEVPVYDEDYYNCLSDCGVDMAYGDWELDIDCDEYCSQFISTVTETKTVTIFTPPGHDWIYTVNEQNLDGSMKAGSNIVVNANHLEETMVDFVGAHIQDIFEGAYGAAFEVPKN
jgi:hypothetical protein